MSLFFLSFAELSNFRKTFLITNSETGDTDFSV